MLVSTQPPESWGSMKTQLRLTLTSEDSKRHLEHAVEVPAGTRALRIGLDFAPLLAGGVRNMLCLSVFGPEGFRGAGHRHRLDAPHEVVIGECWATPGYLPGPLAHGRWTVEIDTHMIHGEAGCVAELAVECLSEVPGRPPYRGPAAAPADCPAGPPLPPLPAGWLRGDLHAHSRHSDARWDSGELVVRARALGLDFVTLSDHNTVSGLDELLGAQAQDPGLIVLPGMELTTFWGHALALGLRDWTDWRVADGRRSMAQIAREVASRGGVFVIAHPTSAGDPTCTGCRWLYPDTSPGPARHVEIFNGGSGDVRNEQALALWYRWLDEGHTVFATAGSDAHDASLMIHGVRFDVVRCDRSSPAAVLAAVDAGRSYLSRGPHLELRAVDAAGRRGEPGDTVAAGAADVQASWLHAEPGSTVRLVVNGRVRHEWPASPAAVEAAAAGTGPGGRPGAGSARAEVSLSPASWCLLELRAADGALAAVTNPLRTRGGEGTA
ncbi:MAG TPA: CehA/McbA family metallohydrolase [Trueperaceae bacterium]|nr:CehA/McbA family metallohydrolase [Trueperaceae bacterium]